MLNTGTIKRVYVRVDWFEEATLIYLWMGIVGALFSFSTGVQADQLRFEQTESGLTLTLHASDDFAPESLVRAMENNPLMNSASLEPGRGAGEWVLTAQLETGQ